MELGTFFGYLFVAGMLGLVMLFLTTSLGKWAKKNLNFKVCALLLSLSVGVVIGACWFLVKQELSGELVVAPTEGISIWPTEGIRLLVVALVVIVLVVASNRINRLPVTLPEKIFSRLNGAGEDSRSSMGWKKSFL